MRKIYLIIMTISLINNSILLAQDSIKVSKSHLNYKTFVIPTVFIATGALLKMPNIQLNLQENAQTTFGTNFKTRIDDYLQFVPAVQLLSGNLLGFKSNHNCKQMITNLAISNIATAGIVFGAKTVFQDLRPDGSAKNSFPSGHTAIAFNNATLLFLEYRESNILYATSGFAFATATGILRVANNRHWTGDVVAGAGIGIVIGTIINYWSPNIINKKNKKLGILGFPTINEQATGLGIICQIK